MADIVFAEDIPAWQATRSTVRRRVLGFFSQVPGILTETDTAYSLTAQLFPPLRRTAVLPETSFQNRTANLVP